MIRINENFVKLKESYLFSDIRKRVDDFIEKNPDKKNQVIRLGIGDVTRALPKVCVEAFHSAVDEMGSDATFKGYGPYEGYDFLRKAIAHNDFRMYGTDISADEILVSDGSKSDVGNIQEIFASNCTVAVPDPVYPVYVDTNVMAGRAGNPVQDRYSNLFYLESTERNNYVPAIPDVKVDLIYLCFPNNPTGATVTRNQLRAWVDYARENKALILYDAAYEAFIRDESLPKSIFEIPGAREVAIEFRSFSKTAGFTGTRCAYTVIPRECIAYDSKNNPHCVYDLWFRRQSTKFNGVSYPVQRAAAAIYTPEGKAQVRELTDYYLRNAAHIAHEITGMGFHGVGGINSPYIWIKTGIDSWEFFDSLLKQASVVCTPGSGFGRCGKGYVRLSAFNNFDKVKTAMERIAAVFKKK